MSTGTIAAPRKFECPNCGGSVALYAKGLSVTAICPSCDSELDVNHKHVTLIRACAEQQTRYVPAIPPGSRGTLQGVEWQAVGFLVRKSLTYGYMWREYLLFNPWHGYRFLTEYRNGWALYEGLQTIPMKPYAAADEVSMTLEGVKTPFRLFERTRSETVYVMGEFYWRVKQGDQAFVQEYIHPPLGLSEETVAKEDGTIAEVSWSLGQHLSAREVGHAFNLPVRSFSEEITPLTPSPLQGLTPKVVKIGAVALALLMALLLFYTARKSRVSFPGTMHFAFYSDPLTRDTVWSVPAFTLANRTNSLELEVNCTLAYQNTEIEAEGVLTHSESGISYPLYMWAYAAAGTEDGSQWKEQECSEPIVLYDLPPGQYIATWAFKAHTANPEGFDARVGFQATRNPVVFSVFLCALILVVAGWLLLWWMERRIEVRRWRDSEFSPYFTPE